jgi:hypothetical protein
MTDEQKKSAKKLSKKTKQAEDAEEQLDSEKSES